MLRILVLMFVLFMSGCGNATPEKHVTLYLGEESDVIPLLPACLVEKDDVRGPLLEVVDVFEQEGYYRGLSEISRYENTPSTSGAPMCSVLKNVRIVPYKIITARLIPFSDQREHIVNVFRFFVVGRMWETHEGLLPMAFYPLIPRKIYPLGIGQDTGV